jgi:hypothetical protein
MQMADIKVGSKGDNFDKRERKPFKLESTFRIWRPSD